MSPSAKGRMERTEDRVDSLLKRTSERRMESIERSLERPLSLEVLRTGYVIGCIILDLVFVPIGLVELLGRFGLYVLVLVLVALAYAEYRLHQLWFIRPLSEEPGETK